MRISWIQSCIAFLRVINADADDAIAGTPGADLIPRTSGLPQSILVISSCSAPRVGVVEASDTSAIRLRSFRISETDSFESLRVSTLLSILTKNGEHSRV